MIFTSVDFPEPFLPVISRVSPEEAENDTSRNTVRRVYSFLSPSPAICMRPFTAAPAQICL